MIRLLPIANLDRQHFVTEKGTEILGITSYNNDPHIILNKADILVNADKFNKDNYIDFEYIEILLIPEFGFTPPEYNKSNYIGEVIFNNQITTVKNGRTNQRYYMFSRTLTDEQRRVVESQM